MARRARARSAAPVALEAEVSAAAAADPHAATAVEHPPTRHDRLSLMGLPAEIRNEIYYHACVEQSPLDAKNRLIAMPYQPKSQFVRLRYPLEPPLAYVSHQLRDEVLPIFYSDNTFKFSHGFGEGSPQQPMTDSQAIKRWRSNRDIFNVIRHVQVELKYTRDGITRTGVMMWDRTPDGPISVTGNFVGVPGCLCFEAATLQHTYSLMQHFLVPPPQWRDPLFHAACFLSVRHYSCMHSCNQGGYLWYWRLGPMAPGGWFGHVCTRRCTVCHRWRDAWFQSCT